MARYLPESEAELRGLRARGYLRESTEEQGANSGPEAGRVTIAKTAEALGMVLDEAEYLDLASGADPEARPEFQRMLREAEGGEFDVLAVPYRSRFGRNWRLDGGIESRLHDAGCVVYYCDDRILSSRVEDDVANAVHGSMASKYLVDLSRSVHRGYFHRRFERGRWSGSVPVGYRMTFEEVWNATKGGHDLDETGQIVPDDRPVPFEGREGSYTRADMVRLIGERYATGAYGLRGLADLMTAEGYRNVAGEPLSASSLRVIISNRAYLGEMAWLKRTKKVGRTKSQRKARPVYAETKVIEDHHEALWSPDLWAAIRAVAGRKATGGGGAVKPCTCSTTGSTCRRHAPLSRRAKCRCGRTLYVERRPSGTVYLACPAQRERSAECDQRAIREDRWLDLIREGLDVLRHLPEDRELRADIERLNRREAAPAPTVDETAIRAKIARVADAVIDGLISREEGIRRRRALEAELAAAAPRPGALSASAAQAQRAIMEDIRAAFIVATPREKAELIDVLFEGFYVGEDGALHGAPKPEFLELAAIAEARRRTEVVSMARPEGVERAVLPRTHTLVIDGLEPLVERLVA